VTDADERIAELERTWRANPDGDEFAALAELYRRTGRIADAAEVVREGLARSPRSLVGRAVLLLVLGDAGQSGEARRLLESWAEVALDVAAKSASPPPADRVGADVSDLEFDRAFEEAEPELGRMITPDSVAEEATLFADGPEALRSPLESNGAFATRTMAELLERQGDRHGAARIRAALGESREPALPEPPPVRSQHAVAIAALERWLENVRRLQP
jgi:tetratricopeptide repeat protein